MQDKVGKRIVLEFLSFLQYKVENDLLTMEEIDAVARILQEDLNVIGTADDFARFYKQPRTNISSVINRRMMDKPVRRVYYRFNSFRRIIPDKWKCHK